MSGVAASEREWGGEPRRVDEPDVTLVLLAGGAGSRMGKRKDGVRVRGKGLVEWMLGRIAWRGPTMLVGAADGAKIEGEEQVDQVVHDSRGGEGPLRGILTALMWCRTPGMAVVPIDMPGLGARQVDWVVARARERPRAAGVMVRRRVDAGMQVEPFPSFYRAEFARVADRRLSEGSRALRTLVHEPGIELVDAPVEWEDWVWANLNREEDVARFERGIARLAADGGRTE